MERNELLKLWERIQNPTEEDKMKRQKEISKAIGIKLETYNRLHNYCKSNHIKIRTFVSDLIEQHLDKK